MLVDSQAEARLYTPPPRRHPFYRRPFMHRDHCAPQLLGPDYAKVNSGILLVPISNGGP